jgi:hypothetical protein
MDTFAIDNPLLNGSDEALVAEFIRIREARAELKRRADKADNALKEQQHALKCEMLRRLDERGGTSSATQSGTFYSTTKQQPSCTDWNVFYKWYDEARAQYVSGESAFDPSDMMRKQLNMEAIRAFSELYNGSLPPAVAVSTERDIGVRAVSKK